MTIDVLDQALGRGQRTALAHGRKRRRPATEAEVYDALVGALLNGRLRPGTQLRERQLAELFRVTRGRMRKVLQRMGHEGRLDLHPNRGAFVPRPAPEEAARTYQARRALEAGIVAVLAPVIAGPALAAIRRHLADERAAAAAGTRGASVKLAGGFHVLLADTLGNDELSQSLRKLVSRTQLMVSLLESPSASLCSVSEHARIAEALERRDASGAMRAMLDHLAQVEARVIRTRPARGPVDLDKVFDDLTGRAPVRRRAR